MQRHFGEKKMVQKTWVFHATSFWRKKMVQKTWVFHATPISWKKNGSKNVSFSCRIIWHIYFLVKKSQIFSFPLLRFGTEKMHFCSNGPYELWNGPCLLWKTQLGLKFTTLVWILRQQKCITNNMPLFIFAHFFSSHFCFRKVFPWLASWPSLHACL